MKKIKLMLLICTLCTFSLASANNTPTEAPVIPGAVFPEEVQDNNDDIEPPAPPEARTPAQPTQPTQPIVTQPIQTYVPIQTMVPNYAPRQGLPQRNLPTTGPASLLSLLPVAGFMIVNRRKQQK